MRKNFILSMLIIAFVGIYIYYPKPLKNIFNQPKTITCTIQYLYKEEDENAIQPDVNSSTYVFKEGTEEYEGFIEIFEDYSYHESIMTIINKEKLDDNATCYIQIFADNETFLFNNCMEADLNGNDVKIGYFNHQISEELCDAIYEYCSYQ